MSTPRKIIFRERTGLVRQRGNWATYHDHDVFIDDRPAPAFSAGNGDACLEFIRKVYRPGTVVIHRIEDVDLSPTRSWLNNYTETQIDEDHLF
ncbi:MAG: hypothetical protein JJ979_19965 [Roseibium sp.]|nr:hypothetical protein [Roseibium sp.]